MAKKYFIETKANGRLHKNLLFTTHDLDETNFDGTEYLFPLRILPNMGKFVLIGSTGVPVDWIRIIEDGSEIEEIDRQISELRKRKSEAIARAKKRKAKPEDFHTKDDKPPRE